MSKLQPVRGTKDLLFEEAELYRKIVEIVKKVSLLYGFQEIATPIFEFSEVFSKTLGDTSDIVNKEMYIFKDRSGNELALRPEGTAGVARSFISNGLNQQVPLKFFYAGPMFRYERPQKGRFRQFHQFGIEIIGIDSYHADLEAILLADHSIKALDLSGKTILELNTLGDEESRRRYKKILIEYFSDFKDQLSSDSKLRLKNNPLRILDSKDNQDSKVIQNVPKMTDCLNEISKDFFAKLLEDLKSLGIKYQINQKLVRGLDYYNHIIFEFKNNSLGSQDAILAGGRYDNLITSMGGPSVCGVGWAAGIDRLTLLAKLPKNNERSISLIPVSDQEHKTALKISQTLRREGLAVDIAFGGSLSKRLKKANALNSRIAVILGLEEVEKNSATVRDLDSGKQSIVSIKDLLKKLKNY